jgi:hypothetical protein
MMLSQKATEMLQRVMVFGRPETIFDTRSLHKISD